MSGYPRFHIKRDSWFKPLLLLFGATDQRAFVEVRDDAVHAHFGWHTIEIPLVNVRSAGRATWPWYAGIGWRSNLRSKLGHIGAYDGIVELVLDPPARARLLGIPFGVQEYYVSLNDPTGFLTALASRKAEIRTG